MSKIVFFFKRRLYLQFDFFFLFQLVIPCFNYLYVGFKMKCFFLMMTFKKKMDDYIFKFDEQNMI